MNPFEVVHGYKPRKPLDFLSMSPCAKVSNLGVSFARKVQDLNVEITKTIQANNMQYKLRADLHKRHNEFNVGDNVMTRIKPEWYSSRTNKKLHVRSARRHLLHQMIHPCCFLSCLQAPTEMQDIDTQKQKKEEKHSWKSS
jgi:hypothetical protein